jgi:hypothetical protein
MSMHIAIHDKNKSLAIFLLTLIKNVYIYINYIDHVIDWFSLA